MSNVSSKKGEVFHPTTLSLSGVELNELHCIPKHGGLHIQLSPIVELHALHNTHHLVGSVHVLQHDHCTCAVFVLTPWQS
ncbi:MAG: hypothetical protein RR280_08590 [Bacteroidaceae bacterium]